MMRRDDSSIAGDEPPNEMQTVGSECRIVPSRFPVVNPALFNLPFLDVRAMPQFIYTMKGLGKVHQPDTKVLEDIWLSFLPGAKIGVLGANGAGKSSILKIMGGEDKSFLGEAFPAAGISVGFLPQEPRLNPDKTVLGNVEEG